MASGEEKWTEAVLVRMTLSMFRALNKTAKKHHRSMPGEIRYALAQYLKGQK